jgi:hypothetical protein
MGDLDDSDFDNDLTLPHNKSKSESDDESSEHEYKYPESDSDEDFAQEPKSDSDEDFAQEPKSDSDEDFAQEPKSNSKVDEFVQKHESDSDEVAQEPKPESEEVAQEPKPDSEEVAQEPKPDSKLSRNLYFNTDNYAKPTFMKQVRTQNTRKIIIKTQNVGAIGIFTHGNYKNHKLIPVPKNVEVNEYNSASDGCSIRGPIYKNEDELCVAVTTKAISDLRGCVNEDYVKTVLHTGTEPDIEPKLSCNLYLKVRELKDKSYSVEPVELKNENGDIYAIDYSNIIFMIALNKSIDEQGNQLYKKINLSLCNFHELIDFFKLNPENELDEVDEDEIFDFISERDTRNEITTSQLVMLIRLAKNYLNVGLLNILDTSCSPRHLAREGLRSFEGYRRVFHNKKYLDPNFVTSYGTKRKRNLTTDKPKTKRKRNTTPDKTKRIKRKLVIRNNKTRTRK